MTERQGPSRAKEALLLALAVVAGHGLLARAPLIYDDQRFILGDPLVTGAALGLKTLLLRPLGGGQAFEPLVTVLHRLLYAAFGGVPWPYRVSSLLLHWLNCLLALAWYRRRLKDSRFAFWGALLFALFPLHAETLAVSTFKKHLLTTLACLGALVLVDKPGPVRRPRLAASWGLLLLGLGCKEEALILPALALAADAADGRAPRSRAPLYGGWAALCAAYLAWRLLLVPRPLAPLMGESWATHLASSCGLLFWYLKQLLWPSSSCLEYSRRALAWGPAAALPAAAALAWALVRLYRRDRTAWLGAAWTVLALLPFLDVFPFTNFSPVADRYLYLASPGFFLLLTRLAARATARWKALGRGRAAAALAALAACYGILGLRSAALFCDPLALWRRAAACAPDNARARAALGAACLGRGLDSEAAAELAQAIRLAPDYPEPYADLAEAYARLGRLPEAVETARRRAAMRPDAGAEQNLGVFALRLGDLATACPALESAARLEPSGSAWLNLGYCELGRGRLDAAQGLFERSAADPFARARALQALGDVELRRGRPARARLRYEASLAAEPVSPDVVKSLARLYVREGRKDKAAALYASLLSQLDRVLASLGGADERDFGPTRRAATALRAELDGDRRKVLSGSR